MTEFNSIKEFYPFYLTEHSDPVCRAFHFTGTGLVITLFIIALITQTWIILLFLPVAGYGFAWAGHFFFEKNKPAAFKHPWWSLVSDFKMFGDILTGRVGKKLENAKKQYPPVEN